MDTLISKALGRTFRADSVASRPYQVDAVWLFIQSTEQPGQFLRLAYWEDKGEPTFEFIPVASNLEPLLSELQTYKDSTFPSNLRAEQDFLTNHFYLYRVSLETVESFLRRLQDRENRLAMEQAYSRTQPIKEDNDE